MKTLLYGDALSPGNFGRIELRLADKIGKLAEDERRAMLTKVRAGEHLEVDFSARAYYQSAGSNRNFIRVKSSHSRVSRSCVTTGRRASRTVAGQFSRASFSKPMTRRERLKCPSAL